MTLDFATALSQWPAGVTLVTIADGRDDIGVTVSAFTPVSLEPSLVAIALQADSYPAEVLGGAQARSFAVTLLAADQRVLAGRFSAAGRPGARLMFDDVAHERGTVSGALIPAGGLFALECTITETRPTGDHVLVVAGIERVVYVSEFGEPLIRYASRYRALV